VTIETLTGPQLSQEERDRFERDGFIVLDRPCADELVDAVRDDAEALLQDDFDEGPQTVRDGVVYTRHAGASEDYHWHRVQEAWKTTPSVRQMALAPRVLAVIGELYGRAPLPFQTLNFPMGTEQHPHIDAVYFDSDPAGYMCGVWIALEDMDMDNGPLVYYPGSHKLPLPDWNDMSEATGIAVDPERHPDLEKMNTARAMAFARYCEHIVDKHGFEPQYGTIRKGQALIWSANLLHGGAPQRDRSRTRHSQVTHYYFEGCRHVRPYQAQRGYVFYAYPEWIREPPPDTSVEAIRKVVEDQVPAGAKVLVAGSGYDDLLRIPDRDTGRFPHAEDGTPAELPEIGSAAVGQLEQRIREGAQYVVFGRAHLPWLEYQPELQNYLEHEQRAIFRDGAYCAIYALGPADG
jgi:ectoine hydroxylase-related dioxygenase (phytanoyl-CoA dioxygenase family)